MAFDKHTGEELWRALEPRTEMGYSQPSIIEAGGARQLIVWHPWGLSSLDPETGALYWEEPFPGGQAPIADAVRSDSYLLVSGFYTGSMMMRLSPDRPAATVLWKDDGSTASWRTASRSPSRTDCTRTCRRSSRAGWTTARNPS